MPKFSCIIGSLQSSQFFCKQNNQSTIGNETINVCTDEDINQHAAKAKTYPFQREYSENNVLKRIYVELP